MIERSRGKQIFCGSPLRPSRSFRQPLVATSRLVPMTLYRRRRFLAEDPHAELTPPGPRHATAVRPGQPPSARAAAACGMSERPAPTQRRDQPKHSVASSPLGANGSTRGAALYGSPAAPGWADERAPPGAPTAGYEAPDVELAHMRGAVDQARASARRAGEALPLVCGAVRRRRKQRLASRCGGARRPPDGAKQRRRRRRATADAGRPPRGGGAGTAAGTGLRQHRGPDQPPGLALQQRAPPRVPGVQPAAGAGSARRRACDAGEVEVCRTA